MIMKKTLLTLMAVLSCFAAKAQWSNDPAENNRINPDGETTYSEQVGSTSDGTTYIVYTRPKDGSIQTVLQILDKDGRKLFPDEGQLISNKRTLTFNMVSELLFVDKQGNAIIPVADCRNSPADKSYLNYTLYKVSPAGEKLWGDEGIDLGKGTPSASQCAMTVIQLEDDSYVAAWQNTDVSNKNTVKIERLSLSGEFLWEQALEVQETGVQMHWPTLTNAGNNLFNLVYYRGNAYEITVKKLDFDGEAVWAKDTKVYGEGFAPAAPRMELCTNSTCSSRWNLYCLAR
ncbi:hypothetical protein FACS189474_4470 [Bacteroidia bacterium]|nr:hypothetical protein FACS189474_4470 [Bacteroidia bacterium]